MMKHYTEFDFDNLPELPFVWHNKTYYINGDFGVDIETTSFYDITGEKRAYPYIFMINICGEYIYCRYIQELAEIFQRLKQFYELNTRKRLIMYIHNLSFEFQFFRDICDFKEVFARTSLKPMKCFDALSCIEFRCSYILSGLRLELVGEQLKNKDVRKLDGTLYDYNKIRHSETPLTDIEMQYCEMDVAILHEYIVNEMKKNGDNITKIPLTRTGYVRRACKEHIFENVNKRQYHNMISRNTPDTELFIMLRNAFMGGDTHGNYLHVRRLIKDVFSFDFASSYPAVMVKCMFPFRFTKFKILDRETFDNLISKKACIFKCKFPWIKAKRHHHTLSYSKCKTIDNAVLDNGRVVKAENVTTYFTDIDFKDFLNFYEIPKHFTVYEFYYSNYSYLPTSFVEFILNLFKDKTELKGLKGELNEALYQKAKEYINGCYGMTVTSTVSREIVFGENPDSEICENNVEWFKEKIDIKQAMKKYKTDNPLEAKAKAEFDLITEKLDKYRKSYGSFLLYQWGVWVTSWARHFLRDTIAKIEDNSGRVDDFIYCDTDSIKMTNYLKHKHIIDEYNRQNIEDMEAALKYHGFDLDLIRPKTKNGDIKYLGIWENETVDKEGNLCPYKYFKTLGAKRYLYYDDSEPFVTMDGGFHLTVSGLNKKFAVPYMVAKSGFNGHNHKCVFDFFNDHMLIPRDFTGKMTHTYIDDEYTLELSDYLGNVSLVHQKHYIHLESQEYNLSMKSFIDFLDQYTNEYDDNGLPYDSDFDLLKIRTDFSSCGNETGQE